MRVAVASEKLLTEYPDLTFRVPTGIGFLAKGPSISSINAETFVVISEYVTTGGEDTETHLHRLSTVAQILKGVADVLSYWVLKCQDSKNDTDLIVFERYATKQGYETVTSSICHETAELGIQNKLVKKTTWIGADVGFVRSTHV